MSRVLAKSLQSCLNLCEPIEPIRLLCPGDSPGKNTGVGCCALFKICHRRVFFFFLAHGYHYYIPAPYKLLILLNGK